MKIALIIVEEAPENYKPQGEAKPRLTVLSADTDPEFQSALHDCISGKTDKLNVSFKRSSPEEVLIEKLIPPATETVYAGVPPVPSLTRAQLRVFEYFPRNLMYKEIAEKLHCSFDNVKTHIRKIYKKLGVHSMEAAVKKYRLPTG
jgi:DNA-binding NarL/FixJ family response regulator